MKSFLTGIFFFSVIFPLQATMFGNVDDLEKELNKLKGYKSMKGQKKCKAKCYVSWNKSVQGEDNRFSKVRYHTRSQTKKHKKINDKLLEQRSICLKKCKYKNLYLINNLVLIFFKI